MANNISMALRQTIQKSVLDSKTISKELNVHPKTVKRWRERSTVHTMPRESAEARKRFIQDLEDLFEEAHAEGNFFAALRAKELFAKAQGFFTSTKVAQEFVDPSIDRLSEENLEKLIALLSHKLEAGGASDKKTNKFD